ncbi:hypothetical protein BBP00_00002732 [Phytophthora kernoviae]|uniref:TFG box profile domain-containing protein n=1 Tax=Phytophthora kernoviae TaxID=325452 RepID=A0A3F2RWG2_9STRA|nr:hypothetical protein BBP00_00002732 [Phytophthora kernoviae]
MKRLAMRDVSGIRLELAEMQDSLKKRGDVTEEGSATSTDTSLLWRQGVKQRARRKRGFKNRQEERQDAVIRIQNLVGKLAARRARLVHRWNWTKTVVLDKRRQRRVKRMITTAQKQEKTPAPVQQVQMQQQVQVHQRRHGQQSNAARTIPGMGGHLLKRKERRVPSGAEGAGVGPDDASGEFNFAEGLNDFDKQQEFSKLEENTKTESKGSYQKSSFFDTISCDALDRLEGQRARMSGAEERKLNTETFGAVGLNNRRNFRGGRGRGGRRNGGYRSGNWNGGRGNNSWNGNRSNGGRGRSNDNFSRTEGQ